MKDFKGGKVFSISALIIAGLVSAEVALADGGSNVSPRKPTAGYTASTNVAGNSASVSTNYSTTSSSSKGSQQVAVQTMPRPEVTGTVLQKPLGRPINAEEAHKQVVDPKIHIPFYNNQKRFYIYKDKGSIDNHFSPSGWMGDYRAVRLSDGSPRRPQAGVTAIRISYSPNTVRPVDGWAGIYWQHPVNNWGSEKGYDLTKAKRLVFWVRGETGTEVVDNLFIGGMTEGLYEDSTSVTFGPIHLTTEWEKYEINLADLDLSNVIGGFGWSASQESNPRGLVFYLDEIYYEQ